MHNQCITTEKKMKKANSVHKYTYNVHIFFSYKYIYIYRCKNLKTCLYISIF